MTKMDDMVTYYATEAISQGLSVDEGALFVRAMIAEEFLNGGVFTYPWPEDTCPEESAGGE